jgi:hypothetical protein
MPFCWAHLPPKCLHLCLGSDKQTNMSTTQNASGVGRLWGALLPSWGQKAVPFLVIPNMLLTACCCLCAVEGGGHQISKKPSHTACAIMLWGVGCQSTPQQETCNSIHDPWLVCVFRASVRIVPHTCLGNGHVVLAWVRTCNFGQTSVL